MDAGLSEILADRVVSFWQTNKKISALNLQNERLQSNREYREAKIRSIADQDRKEFIEYTRGTANEDAPPPPSMDHLSDPEQKRLDKIEEKIAENEQFEATSRINQKLEFQSLIIQFFVQRRFQHALIANDFYRYMFNAEENVLEVRRRCRGRFSAIWTSRSRLPRSIPCRKKRSPTWRAASRRSITCWSRGRSIPRPSG